MAGTLERGTLTRRHRSESCSMGARAELHAALEPANDLPLGEPPGRLAQQLSFRQPTVGDALFLQQGPDLVAAVARAQQTASLGIAAGGSARPVEQLVPDEQ